MANKLSSSEFWMNFSEILLLERQILEKLSSSEGDVSIRSEGLRLRRSWRHRLRLDNSSKPSPIQLPDYQMVMGYQIWPPIIWVARFDINQGQQQATLPLPPNIFCTKIGQKLRWQRRISLRKGNWGFALGKSSSKPSSHISLAKACGPVQILLILYLPDSNSDLIKLMLKLLFQMEGESFF